MNLTVSHKSLNKSLFEELFKDNFSQLCGFAQSYIYDLDSSKEIVQDVFINLWQKKENIDLSKSIKSYLYTSVKNRCLNYIRDNKKFRSKVLDVDIADYDYSFDSDFLVENELQTKITDTLNSLPKKCKQVFELSRYENLKNKEIAERLDISVKTVEAQMTKALKIFRENLKEYLTILILILLKKL